MRRSVLGSAGLCSVLLLNTVFHVLAHWSGRTLLLLYLGIIASCLRYADACAAAGFIQSRPKGEHHANNQQMSKLLHKAIGLGGKGAAPQVSLLFIFMPSLSCLMM